MKIKSLGVLLCISVVFNALFAIGFLRARSHAEEFRTFEGRAKHIARRLDLDADQQRVMDRLIEETAEQRSQMHEQIKPHKEQFLAELLKDEPDEAVIQTFLDQDHHKKRRELMVGQIRALMKVLKPEQKQKLAKMITERWSRKSCRH